MWWTVSSGAFLGWTLGFNDSTNVVGTAVAVRIIDTWLAGIIMFVFATLGATLMGHYGFDTLGNLGNQTPITAFIVALSAALAVRWVNRYGIPVSTSQAIVGSILGMGFAMGDVNLSPLVKIFSAWLLTPIGGAIFAYVLFYVLRPIIRPFIKSLFAWDNMIWWGMVIVASYGAFSLGANNVANVTGVFVKAGVLTPFWGALIGGLFIGLGGLSVAIFRGASGKLFGTVGSGIIKLDSYTALVAVLAEAITLLIFARLGVPVSATQALVGAVIGVGLAEAPHRINLRVLKKIVVSWFTSPLFAGMLSFLVGMAIQLVG